MAVNLSQIKSDNNFSTDTLKTLFYGGRSGVGYNNHARVSEHFYSFILGLARLFDHVLSLNPSVTVSPVLPRQKMKRFHKDIEETVSVLESHGDTRDRSRGLPVACLRRLAEEGDVASSIELARLHVTDKNEVSIALLDLCRSGVKKFVVLIAKYRTLFPAT